MEAYTVPIFMSWHGILAICTLVVCIGKFIDWFLRKRQKGKILQSLRIYEDKIANISIQRLQHLICKKCVSFWLLLGSIPAIIAYHTTDYISQTRPKKGWQLNKWVSFICKLFSYSIVLTIMFFIPLVGLFPKINFGGINSISAWFLNLFAVTGFFMILTFSVFIIITVSKSESALETSSLARISSVIMSVSYVSPLLTGTAIIVASHVTSEYTSTYWFSLTSSGIESTHVNLLSAINFPFDFLTIFVSVKLLNWVISHNKLFAIIAFLDILISALLSITMLVVLKIFEFGNLSDIFAYFLESMIWFKSLITFNISSADKNWLLTPVLLTTFIPVSIYLMILIILGLIIKPFLRFSSYLCGLLSEKENTPFMELAFVLSLLIVTAKALSEWEWFVNHIKTLVS